MYSSSSSRNASRGIWGQRAWRRHGIIRWARSAGVPPPPADIPTLPPSRHPTQTRCDPPRWSRRVQHQLYSCAGGVKGQRGADANLPISRPPVGTGGLEMCVGEEEGPEWVHPPVSRLPGSSGAPRALACWLTDRATAILAPRTVSPLNRVGDSDLFSVPALFVSIVKSRRRGEREGGREEEERKPTDRGSVNYLPGV